jgi:ketosteroid isomerase-like protein
MAAGNQDRAAAFADEWIAAWNSHDIERILSHYAEPLDFTSPLILQRYPGSDGTVRDLATLRAYFEIGLRTLPNLRFELLEVLRGVNGFCIYYVNARGGHTTEYIELDAHDKVRRVIVCYS